MARIPSSGPISISTLNSAFGRGNSLGSYRRANTSEKSNTIGFAPLNNEPISIGRLRGAFTTGAYVNANVYASSTTSGVGCMPRNVVAAYNYGLSNNSDPNNSYTLFYTQGTGNWGHSTTCNIFRQSYNTAPDYSQSNGMYFHVAQVSNPHAAAFEEPTAWVVALGFNYHLVNAGSWYYEGITSIWEAHGGDQWTFNNVGRSSFQELFDGNNFTASWVSGGTLYYGTLNRAQLRAGVIQPVNTSAWGGVDNTFWYNTFMKTLHRHTIISASGYQTTELSIGWDEYIARGYNLPPEHRLYAYGSNPTRAQVWSGTYTYTTNGVSGTTIDGRYFQ
jgi:hypothetical protein